MSEKVSLEIDRAVGIITLNDPDKRNALSPELVADLIACVNAAKADASINCLVLAANGKGFCSGGNIKDMLSGSDPMFAGSAHARQEAFRDGIQALTRLMVSLDVPVVAAVHGAAIGAGCDLTCMCDIRVASDDAIFAESFLRAGLVAGDGGAWLLPRVIGYARALDMALTCRQVSAQEAFDWGMVSKVVGAASLLDEAMVIARQIANFPPLSVRLNKRLLKIAQGMDLEQTLELSAAYQGIIQSTDDQLEAVAALVEKRPAIYKSS